jgi:post-segregation antitoxin (ccd killing protein)
MVKRKITVTVDEELIDAARLGSESLSAVVNVALAAEVDRRARAAALARTLADWEAEHGAVDDRALLAAARAFDDLDGLAVRNEHGPTEISEVA